MRIALNMAGAALVLFGGIWFLQGINVLPGSFMTGQIRWAVYGGIAVAAGGSLLLAAKRRRRMGHGAVETPSSGSRRGLFLVRSASVRCTPAHAGPCAGACFM